MIKIRVITTGSKAKAIQAITYKNNKTTNKINKINVVYKN
jgi:hypothetical protein